LCRAAPSMTARQSSTCASNLLEKHVHILLIL
jgi:hypothetical protein